MKKKSIPMRNSPEFKKMLDRVKLKKIQSGRANKLISSRRLTLAITRIPNIEDFLVESRIDDD